jgi:hypothetical protein
MAPALLSKVFQFAKLSYRIAPEVDLTYAIAVLEEYSDHIIYWYFVEFAQNEERQGWPDIQGLPCRCSGCITDLQIQTTW